MKIRAYLRAVQFSCRIVPGSDMQCTDEGLLKVVDIWSRFRRAGAMEKPSEVV